MADDSNISPEVTVDTEKVKQSFEKILGFLIVFLRNAGILLVGIVIGMGIVLKDPPIDKKMNETNQSYKVENAALKEKVDNLQKSLLESKKPAEQKILENKIDIIVKESNALK